jgi:hypothetical protein
MELSELLPHLASCADDIALIRSMHTSQFNHHPGQLLLNCGVPTFGRPSMGSWLTYGLGSESQNLPGYVVLTAGRGTSGGASLWSSGFLPSNYQGVLFRNQGDPVLNLSNPPGITAEMQHYGLDAVKDLNRLRQNVVGDPEIASRIASYELAFRMQSAGPELMDLSGESAATLEAYGVDREDPKVATERGGGPNQFRTFSRNCLLARRMVERGVRFVMLAHGTWDDHQEINKKLKKNCDITDQPVAALIKDLRQRGLLDSTLLVWGGEFGRTPMVQSNNPDPSSSGRDHHPFAFSIWMAGGGIKGGITYGQTDEFGYYVAENKVTMPDFHATILHLLGLDHTQLTYRHAGRDYRLTDVEGEVIESILA